MVVTGIFYKAGTGVAQDFAKATFQRGIEHTPPVSDSDTGTMKVLSGMQGRNDIPTPPPGTRVTVVLLAFAAAALKRSSRKGIVVLPRPPPRVQCERRLGAALRVPRSPDSEWRQRGREAAVPENQ